MNARGFRDSLEDTPELIEEFSFVPVARPKVAELLFQLYGRALHPELFEVHQTRTVERGGYEAKIQITNAGHLVTWRYDGLTLTEVAAASNHPLPQRTPIAITPSAR